MCSALGGRGLLLSVEPCCLLRTKTHSIVEVVPSTKTKGDKVPDPGGGNLNHKPMTCLSKSWVSHLSVMLGPEVRH